MNRDEAEKALTAFAVCVAKDANGPSMDNERRLKEAFDSCLAAMLRSEPEKAREWQTIETAPKDGTQVLAWISKPSWSLMAVKWCGEFIGWSMPGINGLEPTHWMPLPSPPAASDGDSNEIEKQGE